MTVITISKQHGCGGIEVAQMVAEKLGYRFLNHQVLQAVAKEAHVSEERIASLEKSAGQISGMTALILASSGVDRMAADRTGFIDEDIYVDIIHDVIGKVVTEGNVVLLGRAGQYVLANRKDAYHFLMVAEGEGRIKFLQKFHKMSLADAEDAVRWADRKRGHLYHRFRKKDYDLPSPYHLVFNMSRLSIEEVRDIICSFVEK